MSEGFHSEAAFITGGSSGIGLAMAKHLARTGTRLALVDRDAAGLERAVAEIEALQGKAIGLVCDVANRTQVFNAAERANSEFGPIDFVMNNAGVGASGLVDETSSEIWDWVVRVNLMGVIYGLEAFVPHLKRLGRGTILNTASMAGMAGVPGLGPYCATKAAVVSLSETLYGELAPLGIGVSVLCPGFVKTRLHVTSKDGDPRAGEGAAQEVAFAALIEAGISVEAVIARVKEALDHRELYIFTHPGYLPMIDARFDKLRAAFNLAAESPALAGSQTAIPSAIPGTV